MLLSFFFVIVMMRTFSLSPLAMIILILGMEFFSVSTWTNQLVMRDKMLSFEEAFFFAPFAPFAFPLGSNFLCTVDSRFSKVFGQQLKLY